MEIEGCTALVTGATRGIGLAIARRLADEGARLILPWWDDWPEDCERVEKEFTRRNGGHLLIKTDLRAREEVAGLARTVRKECGSLHVLINNIERGGMPVVHGSYDRDINRDQWQLEFDTSLLAKRLLFEHFFPLLRQAEEGCVINISSVAAITGRSGPAALLFSDGYACANRAVAGLTETWARMGAPSVRVNELMLGLIDNRHGKYTRGWEALSEGDRERLVAHTLLHRTGSPDEVTAAVLFLLREATFMTGSVIRLDGGFLLGGEKVPPIPPGIL